MTGAPVVDLHAHVLLPAVEALVGELDPAGLAAARELDRRRNGEASQAASGAMIVQRWALLTDLGTRLAAMDAAGVDVQLVSPSPSHYYPFLAPGHAGEIAREVNTSVRDLVASCPTRLRGLGVGPLQHPEMLPDVLTHAVETCGLDGVEVSSFGASADGGQAGTVELSDPRLDEFWSRAEELAAVIFLHPFGCSLDERLDRYYLSNTVSQPAENAVALSHLIFSGVLDRHPDLRIVAAHGGGYLPTTIGRSDRAWAVRPEAHDCRRPPSDYLSMLWFDSLTHDPRQLRRLVETVGADRVVVGSDYPFDMGSDTPLEDLLVAGLDDDAVEKIVRSNAAVLLSRAVATGIAGEARTATASASDGI